ARAARTQALLVDEADRDALGLHERVAEGHDVAGRIEHEARDLDRRDLELRADPLARRALGAAVFAGVALAGAALADGALDRQPDHVAPQLLGDAGEAAAQVGGAPLVELDPLAQGAVLGQLRFDARVDLALRCVGRLLHRARRGGGRRLR